MRFFRLLTALALALPSPCFAQSWSTFLDPSRAIDWSGAGFTIPSYSVNCSTQPTLLAGAGNAAANTTSIQAASASCDATHNVVNIPAGTYYIAGINFDHGFQVIRGAGANSTTLIATSFPSGNCAGEGSAICILAPNWTYSGDSSVLAGGARQCLWSAGYTQGTTSITLSSCGGTPPLNQTIILDQANDTSDTGGVYMCDNLTADCGIESGYNSAGRLVGGVHHSQQQVTKITGVTSLGGGSYTVTISPGVYFTNVRTGQAPGAWWPGFIESAGLENLKLDTSALPGAGGLVMFSAYHSWAKGVEFYNCARSCVLFYQALQSTVRDSYFYGAQSHAATSYNIESDNSSGLLIENNIMQQPTTTSLFAYSTAGSVVSYNFSVDNLFADLSWTWGINGSHSTANNFNLFEGNNTPRIDVDNGAGPGDQSTLFRNLYSGFDVGKPNGSTPIILAALTRDWNVVGNVLGTAGHHTNYQAYATSSSTFSGAASEYQSIYSLGSGGTGGDCSHTANQSTTCDTLTVTSLMRWGNYDVVNGATQWNSTEASPASNTYVSANFSSGYFGGLAHTLPASLYYSSMPSWWPSGKAWPPIGPDVSTGNVGLCSGGTYDGWQATSSGQCLGGTLSVGWASHATSIPAQDCARFLGIPPDGSGSAVAFDAAGCYSGTTFTLSTATTGTGSGTITCVPTGSGISAGTSYSCTVTPAGGSTITSVTGCGGSGTTTYAGIMPAGNCTVTAVFTGTMPASPFSLSTTSASINPSPAPSVVRICCYAGIAGIEPSRGSYQFATKVGPWKTQAASFGAQFLVTFLETPAWMNGTGSSSDPPDDLAVSAACQNVLTGTTTTNCKWKELVTAYMQWDCGVVSQPGSPLVGSCGTKYFEPWNEMNVGRYGDGFTAHNFAVLANDMATIVRLYCGDCVIMGGSVSAGGDGSNASGESGVWSTFLLAFLQQWGSLSSPSLPDMISIHVYPSRTNVIPPFPETLKSSDPLCPGTTNSSCRTAVIDQIAAAKTLLSDPSIYSWASALTVASTEGGWGVMAKISQGPSATATNFSITSNVATVTASNGFTAGETVVLQNWSTGTYLNGQTVTILSGGLTTSAFKFNFTHTNVASTADTGYAMDSHNAIILRAYVSRYLIALWQQNPAFALWYEYGKDGCWGPMAAPAGVGIDVSACATNPKLPTLGAYPWLQAWTQTISWLNSAVASGSQTSTAACSEHIFRRPVTIGGAAAELAWFGDGTTVGSCSLTTSFTSAQDLYGNTSAISGSVTLTNEPKLLTAPAATAPRFLLGTVAAS